MYQGNCAREVRLGALSMFFPVCHFLYDLCLPTFNMINKVQPQNPVYYKNQHILLIVLLCQGYLMRIWF